RIQRRARAALGSRYDETGSSASQRSMSSTRAFGERYRSSGSSAMAFRQVASKARSIVGATARGCEATPRDGEPRSCTAEVVSDAVGRGEVGVVHRGELRQPVLDFD